MKHIYRVIGICGILLISFLTVNAQSIDVIKDLADPNTKLFSDGKTDVATYVNDALASKTSCFGEDNVYLQVKLDDCGYATSVRALSGKKECIKKSVEDIVKYIRWNLSNPSKPGPIIFSIKVKIDSTSGKNNSYNPLPEPNGFTAIKQRVTDSREGCAGGPKTTGGGAVSGNDQISAGDGQSSPTQQPQSQTQTQPSQPQQPQTRPTQKGGGNVAQKSIDAKSVDTTGLKSKMGPETLPDPKYISTGEKKPDDTHKKSIINERGPRNEKPKFIDGQSGMGIFIKTMFRRFNYCGMAQAYAEVTVETDGTVSGFRIFQTNNDKVQALAPYVIGSLKFQPVERKTIFYFQFQTDVDCDGFPRNPVDKTKFYFNAPDKAPRAPKQESQGNPMNDGEGDVLKQKDE